LASGRVQPARFILFRQNVPGTVDGFELLLATNHLVLSTSAGHGDGSRPRARHVSWQARCNLVKLIMGCGACRARCLASGRVQHARFILFRQNVPGTVDGFELLLATNQLVLSTSAGHVAWCRDASNPRGLSCFDKTCPALVTGSSCCWQRTSWSYQQVPGTETDLDRVPGTSAGKRAATW